jgi:hypothetical protein
VPIGTFNYCSNEPFKDVMKNLELTEGSPDRPDIDGIISNTVAGLYTWTGIEYANFTHLKMYVQGNSATKPWVANGET